ncbi:MAG: hypothetical protein JSV57_06110 [Candidatus Bathyarchaeota archaeon]|nr:MAG: hypothetical protein JSV57_06110 [Candidatus Bathyarchaeota archaeon]
MRKLDRSKLLKFLSEPRYAIEVARRFTISSKLADYHLREAVKSGHVLISEERVSRSNLNLKSKIRRLDGSLRISRDSDLPTRGSTQVKAKEEGRPTSRPVTDANPVKFVSKLGNPPKKGMRKQETSASADRNISTLRTVSNRFKSETKSVSSFLDVLAKKGTVMRRKAWNRPARHKSSASQGGYKPLSPTERICLFQAVSDQPLTYLELHEHFGVSKQIIEGFIQKKLFEEVWGPRGIGVKFRLTGKGRRYLRELEAAASINPPQYKKFPFV